MGMMLLPEYSEFLDQKYWSETTICETKKKLIEKFHLNERETVHG